MMTPETKQNVLALRAKNLTPKQIAKKLGLSKSQVSGIIRANAEETERTRVLRGELPPISECLVNANCIKRLLESQPDGEDRDLTDMAGLAIVVVTRTKGFNRFITCNYPVDFWCLGIKDTMGPDRLNGIEYTRFRQIVYQQFVDRFEAITLQQARSIVFGAANYASQLGFSPHPDFEKTRLHLGSSEGLIPLEFGRNGKPFFASGPYDNTASTLATLRKSVGEGNFDYLAM